MEGIFSFGWSSSAHGFWGRWHDLAKCYYMNLARGIMPSVFSQVSRTSGTSIADEGRVIVEPAEGGSPRDPAQADGPRIQETSTA